MKQLSKHDVNKLTAKKIKEALPFELVSDGEVIALVCDVNKGKLTELPLSKGKQAKHTW